MKKNYTDVTVILDRSGSMDNVKDAIIDGVNEFLNGQSKDNDDTRVTVVQFDGEDPFEKICEEKAVKDFRLNADSYTPRGMTPLNDAIGRGLVETGQRLKDKAESERPNKVFFLIVTDGLENASTEYTASQVKEKLEHQNKKYGWEFVFVGTNIDAFKEAAKYGIAQGQTLQYANNAVGIKAAFNSMSSNLSRIKGGHANTVTTSDRAAQTKAGATGGGKVGGSY